MRKKILNILLGKFLIDQINSNNLKIILFVFSMAFTLIFLSHSVDSKIYKINTLSNDVSAVESNFIDQRKILMNIRMESNIRKKIYRNMFELQKKNMISTIKFLNSNSKKMGKIIIRPHPSENIDLWKKKLNKDLKNMGYNYRYYVKAHGRGHRQGVYKWRNELPLKYASKVDAYIYRR